MENTHMSTALLIEPQDLLFCRDGRPIVPGEGAAAGTSLPSPQVVAGAVRTAWLRAAGKLPEGGGTIRDDDFAQVQKIIVRGPLLYVADPELFKASLQSADPHGKPLELPEGPLIPCPADVVGGKAKHGSAGAGELTRLLPNDTVAKLAWTKPQDAPKAQPLWPLVRDRKAETPAAEKARPGDLAPQRGFLDAKDLKEWAGGRIPKRVIPESALWQAESRTQVGLEVDSATAEDGRLFTTRYLRLAPGLALYVEVDVEKDGPRLEELEKTTSLFLGGDRRLARCRTVEPSFAWPQPPEGPAWACALTPAIATAGRCPPDWTDHCTGLAVPGCEPISGWDLHERRPRPTRWAMRAGSAWHLEADLSDRPPHLPNQGDTDKHFGWLLWGKPVAAE